MIFLIIDKLLNKRVSTSIKTTFDNQTVLMIINSKFISPKSIEMILKIMGFKN